jgi:hypothetical protein
MSVKIRLKALFLMTCNYPGGSRNADFLKILNSAWVLDCFGLYFCVCFRCAVGIVNNNVCAGSVLDVSCGNCFYFCMDDGKENMLKGL